MSDDDKDRPSDSPPGTALVEASKPRNAFSASFLHQLAQRDEPPSARGAEVAGPWTVRTMEGGYGLFRHWAEVESPTPVAVFERLEVARLAAAVMPTLGQSPVLRLQTEPTQKSYQVLEGLQVCGHLSHFDPALVDSMNLIQALLSNPYSLALLLHAAGHAALELAGQIAVRLESDEN